MPLLASTGFLIAGISLPMMAMGIPSAGWGVITGLAVVFLGIWLWALEGPGGYQLKTPAPVATPTPIPVAATR
jgi:hypothetical protein